MKRHQHPSYPSRGGYGVHGQEWRYGQHDEGPWADLEPRAQGPQASRGRRASPSFRDHQRYGPQSDYLSASAEGYGDIDEGYLPPAWDEAGPQHGGYRNTFASDTGGYAGQRYGEWRERGQDAYPRGFAGDGSPSGGMFRGPRWNDPQQRDYQADYGRRQYARSPTDFMDERYPFGHDYGPGPSHYGRGPKGYQRSDQRIHEDICERLAQDRQIDASEIEVSVQGGVVTLKGTVPTRYMKHLAEDCADRGFGVKDVENHVRVVQPDHRDEELRSSTAGAGTYAGAAQKH